MRTKLTDLTVSKFKPESPQRDYHDLLLPGFICRVGLRRKTFLVMIGKARKRVSIGHYPDISLSDARDEARKLLASPNAPRELPSLSETIDEYLKAITIRPSTLYEYERFLNKFLKPIRTQDLQQITASDILAITDKLMKTPTECRHTHVAMKTFFNWCVPRYLTVSPMAGLKTPTKPRMRTRVLGYDELKEVWKAAKTMGDFGCIIRLCILLGQRRGELSKKSKLILSDTSMTIPADVTKNKRDHSVSLSPTSLQLLDSLNGTANINWGMKKAELDKLCGVTNWVIHDLRRTFASNLGDLGVLPHVIERLLNHAAPQTLGGSLGITYNRATYQAEMKAALHLYEAELVKRGVIS